MTKNGHQFNKDINSNQKPNKRDQFKTFLQPQYIYFVSFLD